MASQYIVSDARSHLAGRHFTSHDALPPLARRGSAPTPAVLPATVHSPLLEMARQVAPLQVPADDPLLYRTVRRQLRDQRETFSAARGLLRTIIPQVLLAVAVVTIL